MDMDVESVVLDKFNKGGDGNGDGDGVGPVRSFFCLLSSEWPGPPLLSGRRV